MHALKINPSKKSTCERRKYAIKRVIENAEMPLSAAQIAELASQLDASRNIIGEVYILNSHVTHFLSTQSVEKIKSGRQVLYRIIPIIKTIG
ncbi:hypothetical protein [Chromobacterium amazonense]|uniref:hypothetical protein n=1 Tax=Chromobacterium amazonense TaxID=1382803 RepID=UPI003F7A0C22